MHKENREALWAAKPEEVFQHLKASENGLSHREAKKRLEENGANDVSEKEHRHWLEILVSQFKNALILVLIIAAIIAFFLGETINAVVIIAIVLLNCALGFFQEYRAERALRELTKFITIKAKVMREGKIIEIDAKEIVTGDIVYLEIGDIVPADIRLLKAEEMSTDESSLTGESMPVAKNTIASGEKHSLPQHLHNIAFMGTVVASGMGRGIAIATGKDTFFGKTAAYLKKEPEADFQKNIRKFGNMLLKVIVAMTAFVFIANFLLGKGMFDSFLFAIALAVGITPEVLPIIITISLSNGALKMAKKKVITKKLVSVEDLGNIDTLCCDKTGTLTEGTVTLHDWLDFDGKKDETLLLYGMLCSASMGKRNKHLGNPIDKAIWESKESKKLDAELKKFSVIDESEFDFERRRMSVLVQGKEGFKVIAKGSAESILDACNYALVNGKKTGLTKDLALEINRKIEEYEKEGYRTVAVAEKNSSKKDITKKDEKDLVFLGTLLFTDPPKKTATEALKTLEKLGVRIKIISGDSALVTKKVCNEVGLKIAEERIITGEEIEEMDEKKLEETAQKYNVFARVSPEQKYKIVASLNKEGHIVGYLGDGVNDAPALKVADVGISVDSGTGVAKAASDIILLHKSLRVIADGIKEGRKTFGNITKYILNTISANWGNMFTVALSSLFLRFIPLLPSQILLNNFISDVPNLTISTDNVDSETLKRPRRWDIRFISKFMVFFGAISTIFDLALILPMIFILNVPEPIFRTAWFVESALSEIIVLFAIRTKLPFFKSMPSKWLIIASIEAIIIAFGITYTEFGKTFFGFEPMPMNVIMLIVGVLGLYFVVAELGKRIFYGKIEKANKTVIPSAP